MASCEEIAYPERYPDLDDLLLSSSPTLKEFTAFKDLPSELRLKIWSLFLPPRQVVKFYYDTSRDTWVFSNPYENVEDNKRGNERYKTPTILQICREARMEGLRHLKLLPTLQFAPRSYLYFNYSKDTLRMMWYYADGDDAYGEDMGSYHQEEHQLALIKSFASQAKTDPSRSLRFLAVDFCIYENHIRYRHFKDLTKAVLKINGFERLTLVQHDDVDFDSEDDVANSFLRKPAFRRLQKKLDRRAKKANSGVVFEVMDPLHDLRLRKEALWRKVYEVSDLEVEVGVQDSEVPEEDLKEAEEDEDGDEGDVEAEVEDKQNKCGSDALRNAARFQQVDHQFVVPTAQMW